MGSMNEMKKQAVSSRTGGFMQTRRGTRPLHVETLLRRPGPTSAANVFEPTTPTEPVRSFEQSIAATAGDEFQPEQQKEAELRRDTVKEKPTQVDPTLIESVKKRQLGEMHGHKVFEVDGGKIRDKIDTDFALGGNSARYSYVPEGELWVERTGGKIDKDELATAEHEDVEEKKMRSGETYDQAHDDATKVEKKERQKTASIADILSRLAPVADDAALLGYKMYAREHGKSDGKPVGKLAPGPVKKSSLITDFEKGASADQKYRERAEIYGTRGDRVLSGVYPNDNSIGVYGGGIDPGEDPATAAAREYAEESGYKLRGVRRVADPMSYPWPAISPHDSPEYVAKVKPRMEQFPAGNRTHYFAGELIGKPGSRSGEDSLTGFRDVKLRPIAEAIEIQRKAVEAAAGHPEDQRRMQRRLDILNSLLKKTGSAEFAPGIPVGRVVKRIPFVDEKGPNPEWTASLSLHPAAKRGDHFDLRLVDPKGQAHSWAIQQMPEPGKSTYAAQQATHSGAYAKRTEPFTIPLNVYGGTRPGAKVEPKYVQPVEVISASDKRVHLLRHQGQETEELVLRSVAKAGDRTPIWTLNNATRTRATQEGQRLPDSKPRYQEIPIGSVDPHNDQQLMTAKIDGAHTIVDLPKADRMIRTYSYRPTQRQSGVIEHTFKFPDFQNLKTPPSLAGTMIRAETWGSDQEGKAIPASELGGILNSSVLKARDAQASGVLLRRTGIDVVRYKGKDVSNAPYAEKLEILKEIHRATNGAIELPISARTPEEKLALLNAVKAGKLPETKEGVVLHDLMSNVMMKAKVRPDTDVYVREITTKPLTEAKGQAAGFKYSLEPMGPIIGHVGTGFPNQLRKEMIQNPDQFVGRVAKVQSAGQHVSREGKAGALVGSPAFKEWHIDKTPPELMKTGSLESSMVNAFQQAQLEVDPERVVDRLSETRKAKLMEPITQHQEVKPHFKRLRALYHRLMKDEPSA